MRPIKFRAWDGRKMHIVGNIHFDQVGGYSFCKTAEENCRILTGAPIMRFTGLHDRNGKEIWEGDIVKVSKEYRVEAKVTKGPPYKTQIKHSEIGLMKWSEKEAKFFIELKDSYFEEEHGHYVEVLGNIYENSELLKGEESGE